MATIAGDADLRTRDRLLLVLKKRGPQTAGELARRLAITAAAVRQHLAVLEADDVIEGRAQPSGVGRPARRFALTEVAEARFPDAHFAFAPPEGAQKVNFVQLNEPRGEPGDAR